MAKSIRKRHLNVLNDLLSNPNLHQSNLRAVQDTQPSYLEEFINIASNFRFTWDAEDYDEIAKTLAKESACTPKKTPLNFSFKQFVESYLFFLKSMANDPQAHATQLVDAYVNVLTKLKVILKATRNKRVVTETIHKMFAEASHYLDAEHIHKLEAVVEADRDFSRLLNKLSPKEHSRPFENITNIYQMEARTIH